MGKQRKVMLARLVRQTKVVTIDVAEGEDVGEAMASAYEWDVGAVGDAWQDDYEWGAEEGTHTVVE